jgi:hypothetical protein
MKNLSMLALVLSLAACASANPPQDIPGSASGDNIVLMNPAEVMQLRDDQIRFDIVGLDGADIWVKFPD